MATNGKNGTHRRKRWILFGTVGAALLIVIATLSAALRPSHVIDPSKLAEVERGDLARSVIATGKIEPLTKVEVKSKASGIVQKLLVEAGDRVKAGQILAELDKEQLEANVAESRANLGAARAAVEAADAAYQRNMVDAAGPEIPFLKADMDRAHQLYHDGLIPQNTMLDAEKNYQMAANKKLSAERNAQMSLADINQAKAKVAQAQAQLDRVEDDLHYSTISSPMDGVVLSRDVEVGDAVSSILV